jgi:hypothetical protein
LPDETDPEDLWNDDHARPSPGEARLWWALLIGPVFAGLGIYLCAQFVEAWWHFRVADRVTAVVQQVSYAKPAAKQDAARVSVTVGPQDQAVTASIDAANAAPGGLSPGDRVTVLYDRRRPDTPCSPPSWSCGGSGSWERGSPSSGRPSARSAAASWSSAVGANAPPTLSPAVDKVIP